MAFLAVPTDDCASLVLSRSSFNMFTAMGRFQFGYLPWSLGSYVPIGMGLFSAPGSGIRNLMLRTHRKRRANVYAFGEFHILSIVNGLQTIARHSGHLDENRCQ